jgi:hypothetical protein
MQISELVRKQSTTKKAQIHQSIFQERVIREDFQTFEDHHKIQNESLPNHSEQIQ